MHHVRPRPGRTPLPSAALLLSLSFLTASPLRASVWGGSVDDRYHTPGNWSGPVPNSGTAVAEFPPDVRVLIQARSTVVASFVFDANATIGTGRFVVAPPLNATTESTLTFTGEGIVNPSATVPRFEIRDGATVRFIGPGGSLGKARYQVATGATLAVRASNNIDGSAAFIELNGGAFELTNSTESGIASAGSISGHGTVSLGASALTVGGDNTDATFSGDLGIASLTKIGAGTWTLTHASFYTGPTLVSAGTVKITNPTGSAFGTGAVTLAAGATLTGSGSFSGAFQNNGTYAPGNSPTLATLSAFTQGETGVLEMELGGTTRGTGYDALDITGLFVPGGTLSVTLIDGYTPAQGDSFDLFDWAGSISSTFITLNLPTLADGFIWDSSALYTDGILSVATIPEPATAAMLSGLVALALSANRRSPSNRRPNGTTHP